jgi:hypothetical protein
MGFALMIFWVVLGFTDLLLTDIASFNAHLDIAMVQQGYMTSLRGLLLLLILLAVLTMTALLRRGLVIAPLIWAAQLLRVAFSGQWHDMVSRLLFVSDSLNLALIVIGPALIALLLWQGLELADPEGSTGSLVIPGLWLLLTVLVPAGNWFVWHWSRQFGIGVWPSGYGIILFLLGFIILMVGARERPLASLCLVFLGHITPIALCMALWGWYDGLGLGLMLFLPLATAEFGSIWLELMAVFVFPLLLVLGLNQLIAWRQGEPFLELI